MLDTKVGEKILSKRKFRKTVDRQMTMDPIVKQAEEDYELLKLQT